jgi:hypothetical protein
MPLFNSLQMTERLARSGATWLPECFLYSIPVKRIDNYFKRLSLRTTQIPRNAHKVSKRVEKLAQPKSA